MIRRFNEIIPKWQHNRKSSSELGVSFGTTNTFLFFTICMGDRVYVHPWPQNAARRKRRFTVRGRRCRYLMRKERFIHLSCV